MKKINYITLSIVTLLLTGCLDTHIRKGELNYDEKKSFKIFIPSSNNYAGKIFQTPGEALQTIRGMNTSKRIGSDISSLTFSTSSKYFEALRYRCLESKYHTSQNDDSIELGEKNCNQFSKKVIKLSGSLSMIKNKKLHVITVTPEKQKTASNENYNISFGSRELKNRFLISTFPYKFEINSKYPSESTYANFSRLLKKGGFYNGGKKDPVTGKIFKQGFTVMVGDKYMDMAVETFPYKSGSKAVIYVNIYPENKGDLIDYYSVIKEFEIKMKNIVSA